jgi:GMP synthase (glutamine-hydrolysing)
MMERVLLVRHVIRKHHDRLSNMLTGLGLRLDSCCPASGDPLPPSSHPYDIVVVYGGAESANDTTNCPYIHREIDWIGRWVSQDRPFLGICLGAQLLARALGAKVQGHPLGLAEIGYVRIEPTASTNGFLEEPRYFYQWHREGFDVPRGAERLASSQTFPNQAFRYGKRVYGLQFHPEVTPQIIRAWMTELGAMLSDPGAHSRRQQLLDFQRFDALTREWLSCFLALWLSDA